MPRREKGLLASDAKRHIGNELLQAIREVKAGKFGAKYRVARNETIAKSARHKSRPRGRRV
jgi:putative transcriptional regulator